MSNISLSSDEASLLKLFGRTNVDKEGFADVSSALSSWVGGIALKRPDLFNFRGPNPETGKARIKLTEEGMALLKYLK